MQPQDGRFNIRSYGIQRPTNEGTIVQSNILLILSTVILHLGHAFADFSPQLGSYVLPWYPVLLFTVLFRACILLLGNTAIGQHLHISCTVDLFFFMGMSRYVFDTDASVAAITRYYTRIQFVECTLFIVLASIIMDIARGCNPNSDLEDCNWCFNTGNFLVEFLIQLHALCCDCIGNKAKGDSYG